MTRAMTTVAQNTGKIPEVRRGWRRCIQLRGLQRTLELTLKGAEVDHSTEEEGHFRGKSRLQEGVGGWVTLLRT